VADEHHTYAVPAGAQIATLLPLTNTTAMPGLDAYDPDRWARRRLKDEADLPAREMVTTFGHGAHTCPAQPFSLAAMCASAERFFAGYEVEPRFAEVVPLPVQIGGVARAAGPCLVAYRRRTT
jgi:cytochrome P450